MVNRLVPLLVTIMLAGCLTPIDTNDLPEIPGTLPGGPLSEPGTPGPGTVQPVAPEPGTPKPGTSGPETPDDVPVYPSPEDMTIGNNTGGKLLLSDVEMSIFEKVNAEREAEGLPRLEWNDDLLPAARSHSLSLAEENLPLTEPALLCKRPFIHHEGFDSGSYAIDRLYNRSIFYFAAVGENLFIAPTSGESLTYDQPEGCPDDEDVAVVRDIEALLDDYHERLAFADSAQRVAWASTEWKSQEEIEDDIVRGWMESEGHKANILEPDFDQSAIGVAQVNDYIVVTQVFIDRVDCGYKDAQCCLEGQTLYCYEPWECSGYVCNKSQ